MMLLLNLRKELGYVLTLYTNPPNNLKVVLHVSQNQKHDNFQAPVYWLWVSVLCFS